jgi:hypothetical protein
MLGNGNQKNAPELTWTNSVHPQFEEAAELDRVRRRYDVGLAGLCHTIPRVKEQPEFRATIEELRRRGWKDWHVLSAMLNAAANYRACLRLGDNPPPEDLKEAIRKEIFSPETADRPLVPATVFGAEPLEFHLLSVSLSSLSIAGFEIHQRFPNRSGLVEYVRCRLRYFDLDVPHPDIFDVN